MDFPWQLWDIALSIAVGHVLYHLRDKETESHYLINGLSKVKPKYLVNIVKITGETLVPKQCETIYNLWN